MAWACLLCRSRFPPGLSISRRKACSSRGRPAQHSMRSKCRIEKLRRSNHHLPLPPAFPLFLPVSLHTKQPDLLPAHPPASPQLLMLGAVLLVGRALQKKKVSWIGEAGAALLLGMFIGLILMAAGVGERFTRKIAFKVR